MINLFMIIVSLVCVGLFLKFHFVDRKNIKNLLVIAAISFSIGITLYRVGPQEVGVLITPRGVSNETIHTGWHFISPLTKVEKMDKTVWVYTFTNAKEEGQIKHEDAIWTPTKDGIKIGLDLSVSWAIDPEFAPWILQNVSEQDGGHDARYVWIEENFIRAKTKSSLALAASEFSPIELYSNKRQELQDKVFKRLSDELSVYHIILKQVDVREVFYNHEYEQSINAKKLAEQEVLRLVEVTKQKQEQLKQSTIDKDISIQKAEGEARALQIKGSAIAQNAKIVDLEWIQKWDGKLPEYMLGSNTSMFLGLNKKE